MMVLTQPDHSIRKIVTLVFSGTTITSLELWVVPGIKIDASGYQYIEWISDGVVVYIWDTINLHGLPFIGSYLRASVYQPSSRQNILDNPYVNFTF